MPKVVANDKVHAELLTVKDFFAKWRTQFVGSMLSAVFNAKETLTAYNS